MASGGTLHCTSRIFQGESIFLFLQHGEFNGLTGKSHSHSSIRGFFQKGYLNIPISDPTVVEEAPASI